MAQLGDLIVTGTSRFLNKINGNISGTSSNVTGTVALNHGGTGATTRLAAAKVLTDESVATPGYVVGLTNNWGQFGYTSMANLKTTLGLGTAVGMHLSGIWDGRPIFWETIPKIPYFGPQLAEFFQVPEYVVVKLYMLYNYLETLCYTHMLFYPY